MPANGLLVNGHRVLIPGLEVIGPGDAEWCKLDPGDYGRRQSHDWVRQIIVHTTKGKWPQKIVAGRGAGGRDKNTANYWSISTEGKKQHGGAHLIVDDDGSVACLGDLAKIAAYHATTSNAWSIGIEMYQNADNSIYADVLASTVTLVRTLCEVFSIPYQIPSRAYNNDAIDRMKFNGGPDMVGVFGHRDNAWDFVHKTSSRGRGDPGDEIYNLMRADGAEPLAFEKRADIEVWTKRQTYMNKQGAHLKVDGIAGPNTMSAMRAQGFASGRDIPSS